MTIFLELAYYYHLSSSLFWRFWFGRIGRTLIFGHFIIFMSYGHFITYPSHLWLSVIAAQHSALPFFKVETVHWSVETSGGRRCDPSRCTYTKQVSELPPQKKTINNPIKIQNPQHFPPTPHFVASSSSIVNSAIQTGRITHVTSSIRAPSAQNPFPAKWKCSSPARNDLHRRIR